MLWIQKGQVVTVWSPVLGVITLVYALIVLLVATALSTYKPRERTRYGARD